MEALLFSSPFPLSLAQISKILGRGEEEVEKALRELEEIYRNRGGALEVVEIGGKWRMQVREEYAPLAARVSVFSDLSSGELKVLAYLMKYGAAKQSEVVKKLGTRAYGYIKSLEKKGFVRRKKKDKTAILELTDAFASYFRLG